MKGKKQGEKKKKEWVTKKMTGSLNVKGKAYSFGAS